MKVNVVWGAPASGKSTYVVENIGKNDIRFDFDLLMRTLSGLGPHVKNSNITPYILGIRALIITKLKDDAKLDNAWIVVTWVDDWFKEKLKDFDDVVYKLMDTTEEECIKRVEDNDDRQASKDEQIKIIKEWFKKYKKLKEDEEKRKRILIIRTML
jgi:hypothetical protein